LIKYLFAFENKSIMLLFDMQCVDYFDM